MVVDAIDGCPFNKGCSLRLTATGRTEPDRDVLSVWSVGLQDRASPRLAMNNPSNLIARLNGTDFVYNNIFSTLSGMFLLQWTTDAANVDAGWSVNWAALETPPPPVGVQYCKSRNITAPNGAIEEGSGHKTNPGTR